MNNSGLLEGYKVLDLSQYLPGPFATRMLADHGATVIKVEPPHGDPMRRFMYNGSEDTSSVYRHLNRGKRVVRLDLKLDPDKEILNRLITDADVLLESFRPGVMSRLGYNRTSLKALNPKLVHCALSGFGQTGPYRDHGGHDLTYCAASGMLSASGTSKRPVMSFPPLADHAGATQAVTGILAALLYREKHHTGTFLDISLYESALAWHYLMLDEDNPLREELLLNGGAACYNIYRTSDDRFVALAPLEEKFWRNFCNAVDHTDWLDRQSDPLPQDQLISEIAELFASDSLQNWKSKLGSVDCCFEPILNPDEVASHPQARDRGLMGAAAPASAMWINGKPVASGNDVQEVENSSHIHW